MNHPYRWRRCRVLLLCLLPCVSQADDALQVFVSVLPQKTLVERVGGHRVRVTALVKPGFSPETYDPTPRQIAALGNADVYVLAGMPFEDAWIPRIRAVNPDLQVLDTGLRPGSTDDNTRRHRGSGDPHVWTSPALAKIAAASIRDGLARLLPADREHLDAGYAALADELDALDAEIRDLFADLEDRRFVVHHPAWGHFADTFGLTQLAIERDGKEPGARSLADLIDEAREAGIRVVFVQPQFHSKTAEQVAARIGGRLEEVDPLAPQIGPNLRSLARLIVQDRS